MALYEVTVYVGKKDDGGTDEKLVDKLKEIAEKFVDGSKKATGKPCQVDTANQLSYWTLFASKALSLARQWLQVVKSHSSVKDDASLVMISVYRDCPECHHLIGLLDDHCSKCGKELKQI